MGFLQGLLLVLAVVGAVWLAALAVLAYLRLGPPDPPDTGSFHLPLPTALLVGGLLGGLLVAALARPFAAAGARRRARSSRRRLDVGIREVAEVELVAPLEGLLQRHERLCAAVTLAAAP